MENLNLRNAQAPGDIVILTSAVRDLSLQLNGRFGIRVMTPCPSLWENNPHLAQGVASNCNTIQCHYPLIHRSNQEPWHFIHGFHHYLSEQLGVRIRPTAFKGDIHLSSEEQQSVSQAALLTGVNVPFWIVVSGGKNDFTAKWWAPARMQAVVDHFCGRVLFVQVGEAGHHHPPLRGVLDFRGKTTLRQLVVLMHHAQGVICPVTLAMHLAAAVDTKPGMPPNRPCVVIAGGREPMQWEAYPFHQYIHTNGALSCCATGGCWKSRVVPLRDGDAKDRSLCAQVVRVDAATGLRLPEKVVSGGQFQQRHGTTPLPRCLDMISADEVIRRTELYFDGGAARYLTRQEARACAERIPSLGWNEVLRPTVSGFDSSETPGEDERVWDDGWEQLLTGRNRSSALGSQPRQNTPPKSMTMTTNRVRPSKHVRSRLPPAASVTLCIFVAGNSAPELKQCVRSIQRYLPRRSYRLIAGSMGADLATRESLRRLQVTGAIDEWDDSPAGKENPPAETLRVVLAHAQSEFVVALSARGQISSPDAVSRWLECIKGDDQSGLWLLADEKGEFVQDGAKGVISVSLLEDSQACWVARPQILMGLLREQQTVGHGGEGAIPWTGVAAHHRELRTLPETPSGRTAAGAGRALFVPNRIPAQRKLSETRELVFENQRGENAEQPEVQSERKEGNSAVNSDSKHAMQIHFPHGLGDAANFAHLLMLYRQYGYEFSVNVSPDKQFLFDAIGVGQAVGQWKTAPWYHGENIARLNNCNHWRANKTFVNLTSAPFPKIGSLSEQLWRELSQVAIDITENIDASVYAEVDAFFSNLPRPIVLMHSMGNTSQGQKSMPAELAIETYREILEQTGGSILLLDWDNRVPKVAHGRVRHLGDDWKRLSIPETLAAMIRADLYVGVDSGPLHLSRFTKTPAVGLWFGRHHPALYSLPRKQQVNITLKGEMHHASCISRWDYNIVEEPTEQIRPSVIARSCVQLLEGPRYCYDSERGRDVMMRHWVQDLTRAGITAIPTFIDRNVSFDMFMRAGCKFPAPRIVETGCIRSAEDWSGAGYGTYLLGAFAATRGGKLTSVDISELNCAFARNETSIFGDTVNVVCGDSVEYLRARKEEVDLLYLDSWDTYVAGFAAHGLKEIQAAEHLLHHKSLVLFDDTHLQAGRWKGKGELGVPWLLERGWKVSHAGHQTLLQK